LKKYYVALFLIAGIVLFYVFRQDPCNELLRTDFADKYPDYTLLSSGADEGSPDSVHCQISYRRPDSEQVHEETWLYQNQGSGWSFSRLLEPPESAVPVKESEPSDPHETIPED